MPRNGGGIYTLPQAAFVPGTTISSAVANSDFSDIAAALTASLARNGEGGMTAVLPLANDGISYLSDPDTGLSRTAANEQTLECGGVDVAVATPTGVDFPLGLSSAGEPVAAPPIGAGALWFTNVAPTGWLLCDGTSYLRTDKAALFAVIGTTYGAADGAHFNVPNFIGRTPVGRDAAGSVLSGASALATALGAQSVTLDATMIPSHTHPSPTLTDPGHTHSISPPVGNHATSAGGDQSSNVTTPTVTGSSTTGITLSANTGATGGSAAHANVQPSLVMNFIIYAGI